MIFRTACVVLAVALGATAVVAQSNAIAERKQIMKGVGAAAKTGAGIAKGSEPYDNAKAQEVFATSCRARRPRSSICSRTIPKTGGDTTASPKIWSDMAGFKAAMSKFEADAKAAQASVKDLDSFKARLRRHGQELRQLPRGLSRFEASDHRPDKDLRRAAVERCAALRLFHICANA